MSLTSIIFVGPSDDLVGYRDDVHGGHAGGRHVVSERFRLLPPEKL
jgi:hypothetical protein